MPIDHCVQRMKLGDSPLSRCRSFIDRADIRFENGKSNEYSGSRSLDKLKTFALKAVKP